MPEPVTLSVAMLGSVALTEGIKFLYKQAGEILKDWRARRETAQVEPSVAAAANVVLPPVFEGQLRAPIIHYDVVSQREPELRGLYKDLAEYATDIEPVTDAVTDKIDALRNLLEAVYGQRITFKGENRPASGTVLVGKVKAKEIGEHGYAIGVEQEGALEGEARGEVEAERIDGRATGVRSVR